MKKVLYSDIATGIRQPYTKTTHEWYNSMIIEAANALAKGIVGNNDTDYIVLFGCENSGTYPSVNISAGAIFHNGEIYLVPAYVNPSVVSSVVGTLSTIYSASDPVLFSDGNSRYVHEIKTIEFTDASTGLFNYFTDLQLHSGICRKIYPIGIWNMNVSSGGTDTASVLIDDAAGTLMPKIKSINVTILDDSGLNAIPLNVCSSTLDLDGGIIGYYVSSSGWSLGMKIRTAGTFDTADYNDNTINRGFITIEYSA